MTFEGDMRLSQMTAELANAPLPSTATGDSLDERIAACFVGNPPGPDDLRHLIDEVQSAGETAAAEVDQAREASLDPASQPEDVASARRRADDAAFRRDRMEIASKRLGEILDRQIAAEAEALQDQRLTDLTERRNAMVVELRSRYPGLVNELADLLRRLAAVDREARAAGISTAEEAARHGETTRNQPFTLLAHCRLVDFERRHDGFIWADGIDKGRAAKALAADAPSQAPGSRQNWIEVPTLQVEVQNLSRAQPMSFRNAGNTYVTVRPLQTITDTIEEADLAKVRELFTVRVIGPGQPARKVKQ